jgi:uncharacterized protein (DUF1501 family)
LVLIIQRGAADGLAIVSPTGDPAFAGTRGALAEDVEGGAKLGSFFTLHPALAQTAKLYAASEAIFVHAVASPYRERSHFDGQDMLETGGTARRRFNDGWMNRLLELLPTEEAKALAFAPSVPLVLRGSQSVASYAPSKLPDATDDLLQRVSALYEMDPLLHPLWVEAIQTRMIQQGLSGGDGRGAAVTGELAAKLLSSPQGARIGVIETSGWDTHADQRRRLATQLGQLDKMIGALKAGLGSLWTNTLVIVATEFGRTVAPNGTRGTDHGTGAAAMLLGGAVTGGRVLADWPGLSVGARYQGRDLQPTTDLYGLIASALSQHYSIDHARTVASLFPDSQSLALTDGLIWG